MRVLLKSLMRRNPAIFNPLWAFLYPLIYRRDGKYFGSEYLNGQQAFQTIFEENRWGSTESRSGRGSTLAYTKPLRPALERYLKMLRVQVFLDAPCGDFNWMKHVTLPLGTRYIGGDIIAPLVHDLQKTYGSERYSFRAIDIVEGPLPNADPGFAETCCSTCLITIYRKYSRTLSLQRYPISLLRLILFPIRTMI